MKNRLKRLVVAISAFSIIVGGTLSVQAREIGEFSSFKVTYKGAEKFTGYLYKAVTNGNGVVNLSNDTGTAWITANMKNSDGVFRGGVNLQRCTRKEFSSTGTAGYKYRLGLKKTNNTGGDSVVIKGSWSPDA